MIDEAALQRDRDARAARIAASEAAERAAAADRERSMRWLAAGLALLAVGVATTAAFVFHAPGRLWLRVGLVCLALGSIRVIASTLDLLGVRRFAERVPPRVRNGIALLVIMVILAWIVGEVVDTLAIL